MCDVWLPRVHLPPSPEVPLSTEAEEVNKKACKDCGSTSRALKAPGPRCATCLRALKKAQKEASWARGIKERYGITSEQYWALYGAQGGACYVCARATGAARKLSVDHDHTTGYVRGLLCRPCNTMLGRMRDDSRAFERAAEYLRNPPAHDVIGKVRSEGNDGA